MRNVRLDDNQTGRFTYLVGSGSSPSSMVETGCGPKWTGLPSVRASAVYLSIKCTGITINMWFIFNLQNNNLFKN